jgi:hypothetical protein
LQKAAYRQAEQQRQYMDAGSIFAVAWYILEHRVDAHASPGVSYGFLPCLDDILPELIVFTSFRYQNG